MTNAIKISLATLLILCLADMPYEYYQLVRMAGLIGFSILGYQAYKQGRQKEMIVFVGLALLFQPFVKVALGRLIWNIVDIIVGISLLLSLFIKPNRELKK